MMVKAAARTKGAAMIPMKAVARQSEGSQPKAKAAKAKAALPVKGAA